MKRLKFLAALLAMCAILLRPGAAVAGAQAAMGQWVSSVAPALFPFLVLMPALTSPEACAAYEAAFARVMGPLLGLPGSAAPAVVIGMVAGSPGGAAALTRIAAQTAMPARQSRRIALAVCGLSPAYLILGVGQGLLGSAQAGVKLAGIQAAVQLSLLVLLRPLGKYMKGNAPLPVSGQAGGGIRSAVETILAVGGCMVFFSALAHVAAQLIGGRAGSLLLAVVDLPSGLPALAQRGNSLLMGMAVGFAGLCIAAQNLDALRAIGLSPGMYLAVRGAAALLTGLLAAIFLPLEGQGAGLRFCTGETYAFSLLMASTALLPALILLTKKFILNKENSGKTGLKAG